MLRRSLLIAGAAALAACQTSGPSRIAAPPAFTIQCVTGCIQPPVSITPDADTVTFNVKSNHALGFIVTNNLTTGAEFHFNQCSTTGGVTCTSLVPDSTYIAAGGMYDGLTAYVHVGLSGGTVTVGTIVFASGHVYKDTGSYTIIVP